MAPSTPSLRSVANDTRHLVETNVTSSASTTTQRRSRTIRPVTLAEGALGLAGLAAWLGLFAAGILIDTEPYRVAISPEGVIALKVESGIATNASPAALPAASTTGLAMAWWVVLTCFLPLNLAWLCVVASTLGAVGGRTNLSDDAAPPQPGDNSHPYMSALLRGFFVYLFMMSGLLLLEHAPFANAGPSQYIRLAGFLSLFSFVVSYRPQLFASLLQSASERINGRAGADSHDAMPSAGTKIVDAQMRIKEETVFVTDSEQPIEKPN